jgi:hypothetical protein
VPAHWLMHGGPEVGGGGSAKRIESRRAHAGSLSQSYGIGSCRAAQRDFRRKTVRPTGLCANAGALANKYALYNFFVDLQRRAFRFSPNLYGGTGLSLLT